MSFGYVDGLDFKTFCFTECMWLISEILPLGSLFTNVIFFLSWKCNNGKT